MKAPAGYVFERDPETGGFTLVPENERAPLPAVAEPPAPLPVPGSPSYDPPAPLPYRGPPIPAGHIPSTDGTSAPGRPAQAPGPVDTRPGAAAKGGYLRVYQKGKDGKRRIVRVHRSKLSAAQIKAALASDLNKKRAARKPVLPAAKAATTTPMTPAMTDSENAASFVQNEINRQIAQDQAVTGYVDQRTGEIANEMTQQANAAAAVAAQYQPVTAFHNPTLDANAQQAIAADVGLENNVTQSQAASLAGLIAANGNASAGLMGNMRLAGQLQHRDYARLMQGQAPSMQAAREQELQGMRLADQSADLAQRASGREDAQLVLSQRGQAAQIRMNNRQLSLSERQAAAEIVQMEVQNQLARDQFGASLAQAEKDNQFRQQQLEAAAAQAAQQAAAQSASSSQGAAGDPATPSVYGFGAQRDEVIGGIMAGWIAGQKPTVDKDGNVIPAAVKQPWRELYQLLTAGANLTADQAALLATKSSPDSIRRSTPKNILAMLRQRGVSEKVQRFVLRSYFGPGAVNQFFGGSYTPGGNVLAPGNRPAPSPPTGGNSAPAPNAGSTPTDGVSGRPILTAAQTTTMKVEKRNGRWVVVYRSTGRPVPARYL